MSNNPMGTRRHLSRHFQLFALLWNYNSTTDLWTLQTETIDLLSAGLDESGETVGFLAAVKQDGSMTSLLKSGFLTTTHHFRMDGCGFTTDDFAYIPTTVTSGKVSRDGALAIDESEAAGLFVRTALGSFAAEYIENDTGDKSNCSQVLPVPALSPAGAGYDTSGNLGVAVKAAAVPFREPIIFPPYEESKRTSTNNVIRLTRKASVTVPNVRSVEPANDTKLVILVRAVMDGDPSDKDGNSVYASSPAPSAAK